MVAGSEIFCSCKERLSVMSFSMVTRWFYLGTLPLLLTLSSQYEYGVKANVTFAFSGFSGLPDVCIVQQDYQVWTYNTTNSSITLQSPNPIITSVAGRFLYPTPVQMTDTLNPTVVKSFSTTFIFQILMPGTQLGLGPGLAFIMVPDNITIGGNDDYMGLITAATADTSKNYASDDHSMGVELDTHMNVEFNDPNGNHVCIDVASMNSTENNTFIPNIPLTTEKPERLQQLWIDYDQVDSRMTIYHAQYGQPKPVTAPLGSQVGVNMSVMKEYMYLGFSTSSGYDSSNLPTIFAWSFSNEGEAPQITTRQDVGSPPHANPPPPPTPTPPTPPPNMSPPSTPIPASVSPPPSVPPPQSPPPQIVISPPLRSPTPVESNPPSPGAPSPPSPSNTPPPPIFSPIPGPITTPSGGSKSKTTMIAVGAVIGVFVFAVLVFCSLWYCIRSRRRVRRSVSNTTLEEDMSQVQLPVCTPTVPANPKFLDYTPSAPADPDFRISIIHTSGEDGSKKNFPIRIYEELKKDTCYTVFLDRYELPLGVPFPDEIINIIRKIESGVGIMVVTREFFEKRWPMIELVEFVKLQNEKEASQVRILPLFHELRPEGIRRLLRERFWEAGWLAMGTENHPVDVEEYKAAVAKLCNMNGVVYNYFDWSFEFNYKRKVLKAVKKIYDEMRVVS